MGDRAVVFCAGTYTEYGDKPITKYDAAPGVYLHWSGGDMPDIIKELGDVMKGRDNDECYASARLAATGCARNPGNLSVGLWNATPTDKEIAERVLQGKKPTKKQLKYVAALGLDRGVFVIDTRTWDVHNIGYNGYTKYTFEEFTNVTEY